MTESKRSRESESTFGSLDVEALGLIRVVSSMSASAPAANFRFWRKGVMLNGVVGRVPMLTRWSVCRGSKTPLHEIKIYEGQGHGLTGAAQFDSAARIARFLGQHLQQASS
jgi:hypothetical protein